VNVTGMAFSLYLGLNYLISDTKQNQILLSLRLSKFEFSLV
jgi:hypothetical protein